MRKSEIIWVNITTKVGSERGQEGENDILKCVHSDIWEYIPPRREKGGGGRERELGVYVTVLRPERTRFAVSHQQMQMSGQKHRSKML